MEAAIVVDHLARLAARYPKRRVLSINGPWDFRFEGRSSRGEVWRKISVPGPWQAQFDDLRQSFGSGLYRRSVTIPADWQGRAVLCFGAVNYLAEVFLDDVLIASHEGGYLPFEVPLPASRGPGTSAMLSVRVTLPDDDAARYPGMPFGEIPHGKQSWYGPLAGIWQCVHLEERTGDELSHVGVVADDKGLVTIVIRDDAAPLREQVAVVRILDPDGATAASGRVRLAGSGRLELQVKEPLLWSVEAPNLYRLEVTTGGDVIVESFGFRSIETRDGKLLLNGKPVYLRSALDQDYYPDLIATPPSLAFIEDQFRKAKAFGLNSLRIHIKVPDPLYYDAADRLGLLIWTEVPNHERLSPGAIARARSTLEEILERDGNHPCIFAWTLINEDWGSELSEDPAHRRWIEDSYHWLKKADPSRLVVDNSPCDGNFHVISDLDDFHWYKGLPDQRLEWDAITDEFAARADWVYSPYGDKTRSGSEPLICSEFGNWGLPFPRDLRRPDGTEPWWFATGYEKNESVHPQGIENRFHDHRLDLVFGSFDRFVEAAQWKQFDALKYEIEALRTYRAIQGYVITEFTDCHWECNGLLDMERNPRVFQSAFAAINADVVIVPKLTRYSVWEDEACQVAVRIANGSPRFLQGLTLVWADASGHETGSAALADVSSGSVSEPLDIEIRMSSGAAGRVEKIQFYLRDQSSQTVASNFAEVMVLPRRAVPDLTVDANGPATAELLSGLGYRQASGPDASLIVTRRLTLDHLAALAAGRNVLLLANSSDALTVDDPARSHRHPRRFPRLQLVKRAGSPWIGEWASAFSWLRRSGAFARIPGSPMIGQAFDAVIPTHVVTGFKLFEFTEAVQAGVVVGWVQKPAVYIGERSWGAGRLVISTFRFDGETTVTDPVAAHLFDALVAHAAGTRGQG